MPEQTTITLTVEERRCLKDRALIDLAALDPLHDFYASDNLKLAESSRAISERSLHMLDALREPELPLSSELRDVVAYWRKDACRGMDEWDYHEPVERNYFAAVARACERIGAVV